MDLGEVTMGVWSEFAWQEDRDWWRAVVNAVTNLWFQPHGFSYFKLLIFHNI
jgi:hypothetical protein